MNIFILILLSSELSAFTHLNYQLSKSQTKKINIETLEGIKVNSVCFKNKENCLAWMKQKITSNPPERKFDGNAAAIYCEDKGGTSIILHDEKFNEYDYCKFGDEYMSDSWEMYKKVLP